VIGSPLCGVLVRRSFPCAQSIAGLAATREMAVRLSCSAVRMRGSLPAWGPHHCINLTKPMLRPARHTEGLAREAVTVLIGGQLTSRRWEVSERPLAPARASAPKSDDGHAVSQPLSAMTAAPPRATVSSPHVLSLVDLVGHRTRTALLAIKRAIETRLRGWACKTRSAPGDRQGVGGASPLR